MAFANAVSGRFVRNGLMVEYGTWTMTAGTTTGTITPATTGNGFTAGIRTIYNQNISSDTNAAAMVPNVNGVRSTLTVTSAANDTGTYSVEGFVA